MQKFLLCLAAVFALVCFNFASAQDSAAAYLNQLAHPTSSVGACPTPAKDTDSNFCTQYPNDAVCQCNLSPIGKGICARGVNAIFQALMSITGQQPPYTMQKVQAACTTEHNRDPSVDPIQCADAWTCFYDLNQGHDTSGSTCNYASAPTPNQGPCAQIPS